MCARLESTFVAQHILWYLYCIRISWCFTSVHCIPCQYSIYTCNMHAFKINLKFITLPPSIHKSYVCTSTIHLKMGNKLWTWRGNKKKLWTIEYMYILLPRGQSLPSLFMGTGVYLHLSTFKTKFYITGGIWLGV